jgi:hypothetical protein
MKQAIIKPKAAYSKILDFAMPLCKNTGIKVGGNVLGNQKHVWQK